MAGSWFNALRRPPFTGLAVSIWVFYLFCTVILPYGPIRHGIFPDPDDYMYLTQTLDWLRGQGWYDITEYRLDPPHGTALHFFHLIEIPLAAIILPLHWCGVSWVTAATIAACIWPLVLLAGLLAALRWVAADFMPRAWVGFTALMLLFMSPLLLDYMPGRVHHHGIVMLVIMLAFGCAVRVLTNPQHLRWGAGVGFLLALAMGIGLEALPWVALISGWLLLWSMVQGRSAALAASIFGASLFLGSAFMVMLLLPPSQWFSNNLVAYSVVYAYFAGGIACAFAGTALAARTQLIWLRYVAGIGLAAAAAGLFFSAFPELLGGPWGAVDKVIKIIMVDETIEAIPLFRFSGIAITEFAFVPVITFISMIVFWRQLPRGAEWAWGLLALLLCAALVLTLFYQSRYIPYAQLFSIVPLVAMIQRGLPWLAQKWPRRRFQILKYALITLLVLNILIAPIQFQFGIPRGDLHALAAILNDPHTYGDRRRIIIDTMDEGAELLFRTDHTVLSAPYHTDVAGNLDSFRFFLTPDPGLAEWIAHARHADLVFMNSATFVPQADQGKPLEQTTFAYQLASGRVPGWLKRIDVPLPENYYLFEVVE